jgi:hypothetical protein
MENLKNNKKFKKSTKGHSRISTSYTDMVAHACNPSIQETEAEGFQV